MIPPSSIYFLGGEGASGPMATWEIVLWMIIALVIAALGLWVWWVCRK